MTNLEFQIENFMLYCTSKNLSKKTLASYEQSVKLFAMYLAREFEVGYIAAEMYQALKRIQRVTIPKGIVQYRGSRWRDCGNGIEANQRQRE